MEHNLSACILANPYFSCTVCPAKVGMHAPNACFISAACFTTFYRSPYILILKIPIFFVLVYVLF